MSRFLLLIVFMLWLSWTPAASAESPAPLNLQSLSVFLGFFALLVLVMGLWSRLIARRIQGRSLHRYLRRFNRMMLLARLMIPIWFGLGLFALGWGTAIVKLMPWSFHHGMQLPPMLVGTLPALLTWMGLWWSQYPADRALREQSIISSLENDLPIYSPPAFRAYFSSNLRMQVLFTAVPILLILLLRDALHLLLSSLQANLELLEPALFIAATVLVLLASPEILRRVLHTRPLPASPLRDRLEKLCQRHNLKFRQILLWHTHGNMGNAAVMGLLPRWRYVLLSDLLLETMTDEQIEAVFAHEVGHIVHRHMIWYVVLILILVFAMDLAATFIDNALGAWRPEWLQPDLMGALIGIGVFFALFGYFSRRFERQADVFAARTVLAGAHDAPIAPQAADLFTSALRRVASINNIPVHSRSWCHGSIAQRVGYVHRLADNPKLVAGFDRFMRHLYIAMVVLWVLGAGWIGLQMVDQHSAPQATTTRPAH